MKWFEENLLKYFEGKVKRRLVEPGGELRLLSRVRGRKMGMSGKRTNSTPSSWSRALAWSPTHAHRSSPGRNLSAKEVETDWLALEGLAATSFRALVSFNVAGERPPHIAFAVKELCRSMTQRPSSDFCSSGQQAGEQLLEEKKEQLRPPQETKEELPRSG